MSEVIKNKIRQLYQFLREANQIKLRPVRQLSDQVKVFRLAELPDHPAMQLYRPVQLEQTQEIPDTLLRIKRPTITRCPTPPDSLAGWLLPGWDIPAKIAECAQQQNSTNEVGETITIEFTQDEQRVKDFASWLAVRQAWVTPELIARKALRFFEVFYDIYSTFEKDSEQLEIMIADGHLGWRALSSIENQVVINHPILLKRVELRFNAAIPEFTVHETDRETELYNSLFVDLENVSAKGIKQRKNDLEAAGYHPLGWEDTTAFLKAFIQTLSPTQGEFLDAPSNQSNSNPLDTIPRLWRDPVLLLRKRITGIANAVDAIIDDIEQQEYFPPALAQITGTFDEWQDISLSAGQENTELSTSSIFNEADILLSKEANKEQLQIIKRLHTSGSVIVQGPPGTGKTHTIGNIIGHLLSQGKSILVTAHTAKALRVLRDKVPGSLKPLCVSVLGSDQDARQQLEMSISSITERLTGESAETLLQQAALLEQERKHHLSLINQLTHQLREALENEYKEIIVGDKRFSPSDAARFIVQHENQQQWIPGPLKPEATINLSMEELAQLYALGSTFSAEEEKDVKYPLPELTELPAETQFRHIVAEYQHLLTCDLSVGQDYWQESTGSSAALEEIAHALEVEFSDDLKRHAWRPHAIVAGIHGETEREVWEQLITAIEKTTAANTNYVLALQHNPQLSKTIPIHQQKKISLEICEHLDAGGKLGFLQLATRSEWKQWIKDVSVTAGKPQHAEHFQALHHLAHLEFCRQALETPWNHLIGQKINQLFDSLDTAPELSCRALIPEIRRCFNWHNDTWGKLKSALAAEGLLIEKVLASLPQKADPIAEYLLIEQLAIKVLPDLLVAEIGRRKLAEYEAQFNELIKHLISVDQVSSTEQDSYSQGCIGRIIQAVHVKDVQAYAEALNYTRRIKAIRPQAIERNALLKKLKLVAPNWAKQIFYRQSPHHQANIPGDVTMAWIWRQLHEELARRDQLDADALQKKITTAQTELRQLTESLIDTKAWGKQLERLQQDNSMRQALVGWLDTMKRLISRHRVDRRQALLSESRRLMKKCSGAVPVWVMPIALVAENFDPRTTHFDVVIIDEASQANLNALIPLYMGKKVIVVGDHEQVTPLGIGEEQTSLDHLRSAMLQDIPNSHLFDHQSSIYDIGRQSFGDAIRLVEHFRCVPEIIAFSNKLSYEGSIRPLRESNSTHLKPACVPYQVKGVRDGDINLIEAEQIVALIKAMTQHPAYAGKSIGIISMLKENQAKLIQSLIHKSIDSLEIEQRRIQSGIPGTFQGDERDIIFLSMVDSPAEQGTLRAVHEGAFESNKKRYNVAASRARDQLWVIHSFDPELHLKTSDIRFNLLQHMKDPLASIRLFDQETTKTESPFEREVLKRLTDAGFQVKTQWQVGYYRIDMVVEGNGKRLAVECDGDRYHPLEKLAEDMERQAVLERLGWQFARIRGSAFYRNPTAAMKIIFDRLAGLEIQPQIQTTDKAPIADMSLVYELEKIIEII